jgi:uncharacterized repeat protein (TIGR01451 family)
MTRSRKLLGGIGWALLLSVVGLAGCADLRVPAIDQSGERFFLPPPAYTTLVTPEFCPPQLPCFPEPAFTTPPPPPPCPPSLEPAPAVPSAPSPAAVSPPVALPPSAGREGRLMVAPARMVAPVGEEVVLTAGFCGAAGRYVVGQPIEWILSQDSVGHFVEVNGAGRRCLRRVLPKSSGKFSADFAVARTCAKAQVITRGTPTPTDDVLLKRGQTWITLTSQTEGSSHVTVIAPDAAGWDRRRQSAAVHWVDAQWVLPPPAIVRAGETHLLTTTVTRRSGAAPSPPWLVRYEIVSGAAGFAPDGQAAVEVATDAQGRASIQLLPQPNQSGAAQVRVQIIRPGISGGDLPRTVVGEGWTTVTWSAPGLAVAISGPQTASLGAAIAYRVEATNPGEMTTPDVVAHLTLPPGMSFLNSTPPGEIFGNRVQWRLGDLAAKEARVIDVRCRGERAGEVRMRVEARSATLTAEGVAATRIAAPALRVQMSGPEKATVGERAQFKIEVTNLGQETLANVTVTDRFDPGLEHSERQVSPIVRMLGDLAPGDTRRFAVTFIVRQPGRHCHALEAASEDGQRASARACLDAAVAPAVVELDFGKTGPAQRRVGEIAEYIITIANTGTSPLTNVRITDQHAATLEPKFASRGFQRAVGELAWTIERLTPGDKQTLQVNCLCLNPDPAARNRVTLTADQDVTRSAEAVTEILAGEAEPPPAAPDDAGVAEPGDVERPADGHLKVSVAETDNPIRVGEKTTYIIVVENDRDVSDKNLALTIRIPEGVRYERWLSSFPVDIRPSDGGRVIEVPSIAEVRPGEKLTFRLEVEAVSPGRQLLRLEVSSLRQESPVEAERETTVLSQ